jgi:hypothetical protein
MNFKYEDHKAHEGTQKGVLKTYTLPGNFLAEIRTHSPFLSGYSFRVKCPVRVQSAHAQVVQLAPKVRNRNVLRVSGNRGLPLKDAAPFA